MILDNYNKKHGFTLIELLAVIVILGIILAIAVPSVVGIIENSKNQAYDKQKELIMIHCNMVMK